MARSAEQLHEPPLAERALAQAESLHHAGDHAAALQMLADLKARREPLRGVDLLRARCFEALGDAHSAEQARREETRWFASEPTCNTDIHPPADTLDDDAWFEEVVERIRPFTMLSRKRLVSLASLARSTLAANIGGDFVECGVAAGGSAALLAACMKRYGRGRHLWCFDTFTGMPAPTVDDVDKNDTHADRSGWGAGTCSAPQESLARAAELVGARDRLVIRPGLFEVTLPVAAPRLGRISLLHLDGDWYESTRVCLEELWDHVAPGGAIQIDDYGHWKGCRRATDEFLARRGIRVDLAPIDYTGVAFRKPGGAVS